MHYSHLVSTGARLPVLETPSQDACCPPTRPPPLLSLRGGALEALVVNIRTPYRTPAPRAPPINCIRFAHSRFHLFNAHTLVVHRIQAVPHQVPQSRHSVATREYSRLACRTSETRRHVHHVAELHAPCSQCSFNSDVASRTCARAGACNSHVARVPYGVRSPRRRAPRGLLTRLVPIFSPDAATRVCARAWACRAISHARGTAYVHHVVELHDPCSRCSFPCSIQTRPRGLARPPPRFRPPEHTPAAQTMSRVRSQYGVRSPCPRASPGPLMTLAHSVTSHLSPLDPILATAPDILVKPGPCNRFHTQQPVSNGSRVQNRPHPLFYAYQRLGRKFRTQAGHGTFTMSPSFTRCIDRVLHQLTVLSSRRGDAAKPFRALAVPRTFTMSPSFTPRAHDARFRIQSRCRPRAWARAPPSPRAGASSNLVLLRAPAVPRTFTMFPGFARPADESRFRVDFMRWL